MLEGLRQDLGREWTGEILGMDLSSDFILTSVNIITKMLPLSLKVKEIWHVTKYANKPLEIHMINVSCLVTSMSGTAIPTLRNTKGCTIMELHPQGPVPLADCQRH